MHFKITRSIASVAFIGMLALAPASAFARSGHHGTTPAKSSEAGNVTLMDVLQDMSRVMQRWMTEMSDSRGLSAAEAQRMAGAMQTMSGVMRDMSSMMQRATQSGPESNDMMGGGPGTMESVPGMMGSGPGTTGSVPGMMKGSENDMEGGDNGMMMDSQMMERMQRMREQLAKLLAQDEG